VQKTLPSVPKTFLIRPSLVTEQLGAILATILSQKDGMCASRLRTTSLTSHQTMHDLHLRPSWTRLIAFRIWTRNSGLWIAPDSRWSLWKNIWILYFLILIFYYMRSFYLRFWVYVIEKMAFFSGTNPLIYGNPKSFYMRIL